jgi:hypothetical protein
MLASELCRSIPSLLRASPTRPVKDFLDSTRLGDIEETEDGFKITIRRSKTDQEGHGGTIRTSKSRSPP